MAKPAILAVDDDVAVVAAVVRDLRQRYGEDYRVLRATSGSEALEILADQLLKDRPIAAVVSDQRMPGMSGIDVLRQVREQSPDTKILLLTAYADTEVAIQAINDIALDYYLLKPWDPPEDRLYPVLDELLRDWAHGHPDRDSEVRVVGHRWSDRTHEVKTFLAHNHVPYRWLEVDASDEATRLLEVAGEGKLPVVALPDGSVLRSPTTIELADALGLSTRATQTLYDLCVVGAGPAGLAAAVYAASEGLQVVVVERDAPGGQAGQSASIENYLGFPKGLSGADLTHRAVAQAARFGAEMVLARDVVGFETRGPVRAVLLEGSADIEARAVLVASGVSYRRLDAPGLDDYVGRGIYYGASASEATQTVGEDVYVVGAANSAGQAVLNFAKYAKKVVLVVRGASLEASMSQYLVTRILTTPNVEVRLHTEIVGTRGDGHLEGITLCDQSAGSVDEVATSSVYIFIGAAPRTEWLGDSVARDDRGFVLTGPDLPTDLAWPLERGPFALETSVPGVFAAGDVRRDSMKRVASAVGEGAMSVYLVHRYLAAT
ncbi:FAD-dependent oxidoreductase [Nocardioides zhouii]|uniref:FAD-dependent oxidoreductase n=1 Tax=Nocardioides zhouii TaxID=1168729 RepID=A0A4V1RPU7_9ACTN|nr:FAD-dependent oxidoreductase [Nocardioides zhouii]RYC10597.1 FAD-dependent oxidoreductase [Nocardioides zhouii]